MTHVFYNVLQKSVTDATSILGKLVYHVLDQEICHVHHK